MEVEAHVIISGIVQGVGFRMSTYQKYRELGLNGTVRNKSDGTVEATFRGGKDKVDEMIDWCRMGPPPAQVDDVHVSYKEIKSSV